MARFLRNVWHQLAEPFSNLSQSGSECYQIVFIRHGQSEWNQKNQFCGWYDAHLSEQGRAEAKQAGRLLKERKVKFHCAFTSRLCRAIQTLDIILEELGQQDIPIERDWRINERHYGNLTGMNKAEAMELFGKDKVHIWRRSYDTRPPIMLDVNPHYASVMDGKRYGLSDADVPKHESLKDTVARTLPYWEEHITPEVKRGKSVIVAAHGNSLRGIVKHIEGISDNGIQYLNLPTGVPFIYTLDHCARAIEEDAVEFIGDEKKVSAALKDLHKAKTAEEKCDESAEEC